jgi:hypothetical protein
MQEINIATTDAKTGKTRMITKVVKALPPPQPKPKVINLYKLVDVLVNAKLIRREDVEEEMI